MILTPVLCQGIELSLTVCLSDWISALSTLNYDIIRIGESQRFLVITVYSLQKQRSDVAPVLSLHDGLVVCCQRPKRLRACLQPCEQNPKRSTEPSLKASPRQSFLLMPTIGFFTPTAWLWISQAMRWKNCSAKLVMNFSYPKGARPGPIVLPHTRSWVRPSVLKSK